MSALGYLGGWKVSHGKGPRGAEDTVWGCGLWGLASPPSSGEHNSCPKVTPKSHGSLLWGWDSALIPWSLGFAKSLCFSDQTMIKIKFILGEEDGGLFWRTLFIFCGTCCDTECVWAHAGRLRLHAWGEQYSLFWGTEEPLWAHCVSQQTFGKAHGTCKSFVVPIVRTRMPFPV